LAEYARSYDAIRAAGADLVALSVDAPDRSEALRGELALPFAILADTARIVVRAWDLYNPREMGGIAVPAVFVIERDRRVAFRSIDTTAARVRSDAVLRFLRGESSADAIARVPVRAGLADFARAAWNAVRRGLRTPESR
jgi:peroxiredoxin